MVHNGSQVWLVPDQDYKKFKIEIMMKKEQNSENSTEQALTIPVVVKSFYCQRPKDYKASLKCKTQCGICATFEGKRQ